MGAFNYGRALVSDKEWVPRRSSATSYCNTLLDERDKVHVVYAKYNVNWLTTYSGDHEKFRMHVNVPGIFIHDLDVANVNKFVNDNGTFKLLKELIDFVDYYICAISLQVPH
ncbi:unnamed protein product [Rotaria magnacalcarata]|uniref:Uncharacterized protein n=1 Tax=Rotaria magnacalcarata TaxID=392030 RepID=A0A8S2PKG0_9BILA|nr:unnamed protein product [Rotaria magnacalcarata]CAF4170807.1 unnamed protein product [Rotaria magnacalcarata]